MTLDLPNLTLKQWKVAMVTLLIPSTNTKPVNEEPKK